MLNSSMVCAITSLGIWAAVLIIAWANPAARILRLGNPRQRIEGLGSALGYSLHLNLVVLAGAAIALVSGFFPPSWEQYPISLFGIDEAACLLGILPLMLLATRWRAAIWIGAGLLGALWSPVWDRISWLFRVMAENVAGGYRYEAPTPPLSIGVYVGILGNLLIAAGGIWEIVRPRHEPPATPAVGRDRRAQILPERSWTLLRAGLWGVGSALIATFAVGLQSAAPSPGVFLVGAFLAPAIALDAVFFGNHQIFLRALLPALLAVAGFWFVAGAAIGLVRNAWARVAGWLAVYLLLLPAFVFL